MFPEENQSADTNQDEVEAREQAEEETPDTLKAQVKALREELKDLKANARVEAERRSKEEMAEAVNSGDMPALAEILRQRNQLPGQDRIKTKRPSLNGAAEKAASAERERIKKENERLSWLKPE